MAASLLAASVAVLVLSTSAWGHALLTAADPAPDSNLGTAPAAVTLTFSEQPDPKLSSIAVLDSSGTSVARGVAREVPGNARQLTVQLGNLANGVYTVTWRTVSSVDGHLASGSFAFGVGASPPATPASQGTASNEGSAALSPIAVVGRWLLAIGLIGLLGAAFVALAIQAVPRPRIVRLMAIGWGLAAIGTLVVIGAQMADAGIGPAQLPGTSLGSAALLRAAPVVVAGLGLLALALDRLGERPAIVIVGVAAVGAVLAEALTSHAAAGATPALEIAVQWLHLAAVGFWMGGLAMLLLTLPARPSDATATAAGRYAWTATAGIAVVAVTGVLRALTELTSLEQLVTTAFGLLLVGKSLLLLCVAGLGAVNHFRNVPMAGRSLRGLRRVGSVELVLGATILLLSATLVNLAPPASAASSGTAGGPQPIVVSGSDFGTTLRVRLEVSPGSPGFNTFRATLTDYDTGAPLADATVRLRFALAERPDVGASQLDLKPAPAASGSSAPAGTYVATGANLSLAGTWSMAVVVTHDGATVEIPLHLATREAPAPSVDVVRASGLPTIYTVHLEAGRSVQVYLDPGRAGRDEVHVTVFDAAGKELPVPTLEMSIKEASARARKLKARILEPGHFVADTRLVAGTATLIASGTAPDGAQLTLQLDVEVLP